MPPHQAKDESDTRYHQERYQWLSENTDLALADRMACFLLAVAWSDPNEPQANENPHSETYKSSEWKTELGARTGKAGMQPSNTDLNAKHVLKRDIAITVPPMPVDKSDPEFQTRLEDHQRAAKHKNFSLRQLDINLDCVAAVFVDGTWYFGGNSVTLAPAHASELIREYGHINFVLVNDPPDRNLHAEMKVLSHLKHIGKLRRGLKVGVSKPCCPKCKENLDTWNAEYTAYHNKAPAAGRYTDPLLGNPV